MPGISVSFAEIVQALYESAGKGDWDTAESYLTEDFFAIEAPHLPMAGIYAGKAGLRALYEKVFAEFDIVGLNLQDIACGQSHAVGLVEMQLAGNPPVRVQIAEIFRFRGEKVCEIRPCYFDPTPLAEARRA